VKVMVSKKGDMTIKTVSLDDVSIAIIEEKVRGLRAPPRQRGGFSHALRMIVRGYHANHGRRLEDYDEIVEAIHHFNCVQGHPFGGHPIIHARDSFRQLSQDVLIEREPTECLICCEPVETW